MTVHLDLLDHHSSPPIEQAADVLVDRLQVRCPQCGATGATQHPVFVGPDGALDRVDYVCERCETDHPIWVG